MRLSDFILPNGQYDDDLIAKIGHGSVPSRSDAEVAIPLARLVHTELEGFGTDGGNRMSNDEIDDALRALRSVLNRLGITEFDPPFRDFTSFRTHWKQEGCAHSWQARRDLLEALFGPVHSRLADLENAALGSTLGMPVTSHAATGWPKVDEEIRELRRHFQNARTPQDYRSVGLDCVGVTEALSATIYDPAKHLRVGETEPPVANTKQRLERFVEDAAPGPANAEIRKVARASIELAQAIKHRGVPSRRDAGIAADAVIQLANILRRLDEPT